jgi:hypothetical protein
MPLRISASLSRRTLFQSVPRLALEILPEVAPFVRFRSPCRDDASFAIRFVRIDHSDFASTMEKSESMPSGSRTVSIIDLLDSRTVENPLRIFEGNSVPSNVAAVLPLIPIIAHVLYLHNVNTRCR